MKFQKSSLIVLLSISFLSKHTFAFFDLADDDFCQKNPNDAICTLGLDKSIKKVIDETGLDKKVLKPLEDTLEKLTNSNPVDNTNPDSDKKADKDKLIERQAKEIERLNALIQKEEAAQEVAEPAKKKAQPEKVDQEAGDLAKKKNTLDIFKNGDIRLDCGLGCSFSSGYNARKFKNLYEQELWEDLALLIISIDHHSNKDYYYLGKAAEGMGKPEAALTYYKLAKADSYQYNEYSGLNIPQLVNARLNYLNKEPSKSKPIAATNVPTNNINTSLFPTKSEKIERAVGKIGEVGTAHGVVERLENDGLDRLNQSQIDLETPKIDQTIKPIQTTAAVTEWAKEIIKKPVSDFKDSYPGEPSYDKGKYETTSEYQKRLISTWSNKNLYFDVELDTGRNTYDADTGNYRVVIDFTDRTFSDYDFDDNIAKKFWGDAKKSYLEGMRYYLDVGSENLDLGEYVASNSFGKEAMVSSSYTKIFYVYFSNLLDFMNSTSMPANKISRRSIIDATEYAFSFDKDFSIPRSEIRNLEKNLKLRIVVREPKSDFDFAEVHHHITPTIDLPKDIRSTMYYMRSKLIGFILYNGANGDILSAYKL